MIYRYTPDSEKSVVDREIAKAFRLWEEVTPLTFTFVETTEADIKIGFEIGAHSNGTGDISFHAFDGPGGNLAHSIFPNSDYGAILHFDEAETWTININDTGVNLFQLATHELGHILGLEHSEVRTSVMSPIYDYRLDFKLETDDIHRIQELYGAKINDEWLKENFQQIASDMGKMEKELKTTKSELEEAKVTIENLKTTFNFNAITKDTKDNEDRMPTTCEDLQSMGQKSSGIFLVKGTYPNATIDVVFCNFYANSQKWIGHVDVKSTPVYFYVQRNSPFNLFKDAITFDVARVNIGDAMDIQTGIFTAPRSGTYFFSFTGLVAFPESKSPEKMQLEIGLYLSGEAEESNTVDKQKCPLSLQSTLKLESLEKHDNLWLQIDVQSTSEVFLYNDTVHFTGWMLEEEIFE